MILELDDLKPLIPQICNIVKQHIEGDRFITYPEGLQKYLCDGVVDDATYKRVYRLWNMKGFPRQTAGVKGVYLNDLKSFQKKNKV